MLSGESAQGKYPDYWNAYLENRGWMPTFEEGDEELLKYTVDYIAFSYYRSNTVKAGEFDFVVLSVRPCLTNWLIVGIIFSFPDNTQYRVFHI